MEDFVEENMGYRRHAHWSSGTSKRLRISIAVRYEARIGGVMELCVSGANRDDLGGGSCLEAPKTDLG